MSNEPAVRGYVVGPGEGVPDRTPGVKASGRSTGGSLTVMELAVEGGPPRHTVPFDLRSATGCTIGAEVRPRSDSFAPALGGSEGRKVRSRIGLARRGRLT
jgi:hypothetical protein